jgi:hypothetical protein
VRRKKNKKSTYVSKGTGSKIINTGYGSIAKPRRNRGTPKKDLEKDTRKLVREVNARLNTLERKYKSGTWASKRLKTRLGTSKLRAWTKSGRVRLKSNLSKTQLTAINKALTNFLNSKTSTKRGIEDVKRKQIEKIKERLSLDDEEAEEITDEDAEFFYDMFGDNDFDDLSEKIGASALQAAIEDAIEAEDSEDMFLQRLEWYGGVEMQDLDLREKAIRVYNKYVKDR